jgi:hypothetical protein
MFYFVGPNMSRDITIGLCGGRRGESDSLSKKASRFALGTARSLIQCVRSDPSLGLKCGTDELRI